MDDLELSEINYLCIRASVDEVSTAARQNTFNYCLLHLEQLFQENSYVEAVNTTFVTKSSSFSWQMITIFCAVIAILGLSLYLVCRFMSKKDKTNQPSPRDINVKRLSRYEQIDLKGVGDDYDRS